MGLTATATATHYEQHREYVLAVLARRCGWLDSSDREAAFHDAYTVLLEKEASGDLELERMHPQQVRAYLTQVALRKALDEGKRAERKRAVPLLDGALSQPDPGPALDDLVATDMDSAPVREIVSELSDRMQQIVKLRFYFDRTPEEIQSFLQISERVYRRELERAMRQISERYKLVAAGQWCENHRSLMLAYVAGIAGPTRVRVARAHLASCPACTHLVAELRGATQKVAAAIPLTTFDGQSLSRFSELATNARDTLVDLVTGVKQQSLHVASRVDPNYAAGARPGAVATAVAGCVVAASGATYCAVTDDPLRNMVQPLRDAVAQVREHDDKRDDDDAKQRRKRERAPAVRPVASPPSVQRSPQQQQRSTQAAPSKPARRRSQPRRSGGPDPFTFEDAGSGPAAQPSTQAAPRRSPPRPTTPPPKGAPGVFEDF